MLTRRDVLSLSATAVAGGLFGWTSAPAAHATTVRVNGYVVGGSIYDLWWPNRAVVGKPISNEYRVTGGTKQRFYSAWMYTSPWGASIIRGKIRTTFANAGGIAALGIPIGVQKRTSAYASYHQRCVAGQVWWSSADGGKAVPAAKTVRLRGARNFRDAAGTGAGIAVAGGRMRRGVLYRSNKLHNLSSMDCSILLDLGVTGILDLRTNAVVASTPDRTIPGISWRQIDVVGATTSSDSYDYYRDFVTSGYRRSRIAEAIAAIAWANAPTLVHCTYGKDRTGWVVAMIQFALGADEATVLNQWLKSNTYLGTSTLTSGILNAGLAEAKARYGSIEGYLTTGLGLTAETRAALRARLVV